MLRSSVVAPSFAVVVIAILAACVGDDPQTTTSPNGDGGADGSTTPDGGGGGDGSASDGSTPEPPPTPKNETSWAYHYPSKGYERAPVAAAADGYTVVATNYLESPPDVPPSNDAQAIVLIVFDPQGKPLWKKGIVPARTGATFEPVGVAFDDAGDIYLAGTSNSAADFGGGVSVPPASAGAQNYGFVVKLRRSDGAGIWAKTFDSPTNAALTGLAVRGANIALAGQFYQELTFETAGDDRGKLTSGDVPMFAAALDRSTGKAKWAVVMSGVVASGPPTAYLGGVALDDAGHVYVGGTFRGTVSGAGSPLTAVGNESNGFIASFSAASGEPRWARRFGSATATSGVRVKAVAGGQGVFVVAGQVPAGTDFGDGKPIGTSAETDAFVAAFDPATGAARWNVVMGGDDGGYDGEGIYGLTTDRWQQVVAVGDYRKAFSVGGTMLATPPNVAGSSPPIPARCFFGVKIDATGAPVWAKSFTSTTLASGRAAAAHANGSYVVSGVINGTNIDLGAGTKASTGTANKELFAVGWTP